MLFHDWFVCAPLQTFVPKEFPLDPGKGGQAVPEVPWAADAEVPERVGRE